MSHSISHIFLIYFIQLSLISHIICHMSFTYFTYPWWKSIEIRRRLIPPMYVGRSRYDRFGRNIPTVYIPIFNFTGCHLQYFLVKGLRTLNCSRNVSRIWLLRSSGWIVLVHVCFNYEKSPRGTVRGLVYTHTCAVRLVTLEPLRTCEWFATDDTTARARVLDMAQWINPGISKLT